MGGRVACTGAIKPKGVFFVTFVLSFVSKTVPCGREREAYVEEEQPVWRLKGE